MSQTKGVDWSWAKLPITEMPKWGYHYAFRYLCYHTSNSAGKILTAGELQTILSVMDIWANWEWYSTRAKEGRIAGLLDGHEAHKQLLTLNWPVGAYIIASDDSDTSTTDIANVIAYLDGFQTNCPNYIVTVYGSDVIVNAWHARRVVKGWQTLAWSGGRRSPHAFAYQNGNQAFNGGADENDIYDARGSYKSALAGKHTAPVTAPKPLPIHQEETEMFGYIHSIKTRNKSGGHTVYIVAPDLQSKVVVTDMQSLAFLVGTKKYPPSNLTDKMVSSIPTSKG